MLPGPIFNVELLTSARRTRYFFIRAIYAAILLLALGMVYQSWTYQLSHDTVDIHTMARIGESFFAVLGWLQLLAVVALGPAMVAGTIATERERRTIEYLFASSLSNAEIVLGKLAARVLHIVYLVLTGVPILAIMMLMGGIAPEGVLVLTIITLCSVLTIATLSMAISVWSARAREAVTRTYLLLFALLVLPPVLLAVFRFTSFYPIIEPVLDQFLTANPFYILTTSVIERASGMSRGAAFEMLWVFVRNQLLLSFLLGALATWGVRRTHLRETTKAAKAAKRKWRFSHWIRPAVGSRPMLWKEVFAEPAAAKPGWVGRIAAALIVIGVIIPTVYVFLLSAGQGTLRPSRDGYLIYTMMMGTAIACGGLLLVAARAAGSITSERERDCWMSLISTPLEPSEIVWGKIAGSMWSIRGAVLLLLLIWGLATLLFPSFVIVIPFLAGTFALLAFYAAALGVNCSLRCRNSLRSMAATLATALFVGGLYFLTCCMPVLIAASPRDGEGFVLTTAPCVPVLLGFPVAVYANGENMFRGSHSEGPMFLLACILGNIGYAIAGIALVGNSIGNFERLSGRTMRRTAGEMSQSVSARSSVPRPTEPTRVVAAEVASDAAVDAILLPPSTPDIL